MAFLPATCPSCGGSLQVPDNREQVKCMYCGGNVVVQQAVQLASGPTVRNLMELAEAAASSVNYKEAFDYYTRVLELDPTNAAAWWGKGESAGWISTLADMRIAELLGGLNNALKFAPAEEQQSWRQRAAVTVNNVTSALYSLARNHVVEFVAVDHQWVEYLGRCQLLLSALEAGHAYDSSNRTTLENIVNICTDNIRGLAFKDFSGNARTVFLTDEYERALRSQMDNCVQKIQTIDPSYKKPNVKRVSIGACFVVTATLGNENHPTVLRLRKFRDTRLVGSYSGRLLIRAYNLCGPMLARSVARSSFLRVLSLVIFVRPLVLLARACEANGSGR